MCLYRSWNQFLNFKHCRNLQLVQNGSKSVNLANRANKLLGRLMINVVKYHKNRDCIQRTNEIHSLGLYKLRYKTNHGYKYNYNHQHILTLS